MNKIVFQTPEKNFYYPTNIFRGHVPNRNDRVMLDGIRYVVSERIFDTETDEIKLIVNILY